MKKLFFTILISIIYSSLFAQWEWQHPVPQGNTLNDIFFTDQNTGWAVGAAGTIIRTEDGGLSYQVINYPTCNNLYAVQFFDLLKGLAVGDSGMILKTSDKGNTWVSQEVGLTESLMDISIAFPDKVWIVGNKGTILFSNDNGENWQSQSNDTSNVLYSVCFVDDSHGWAGGWNIAANESVLLHTSDGGLIWSEISNGINGSFTEIDFVDIEIGYAVVENSSIIKTTDGGNSWSYVSPGVYGGYSDISFIDPNNGWVVGNHYDMRSWDSFIIRTSDGGKTWDYGIIGDSILSYGLNSVYFLNADLGWAVGSNGNLTRTIDGGQNMIVTCSSKIGHPALMDVTFADSIHGWAVGGGHPTLTAVNSLLLHTEDGGNSWFEQEAPYAILESVFFINKLEGWITGRGTHYDPNIISHTINGGISWEIQYSNMDTASLRDICFTDAMHGWAVGGINNYYPPPDHSKVLFTENGGESWEDMSYLTEKSLSGICFIDKENGWIAGNEIILRTNDGGQNWDELWSENYVWSDIYFTDSDYGWVIGDSVKNGFQGGKVMRTTDGGITWDESYLNNWSKLEKIFFIDRYNGWISGSYLNKHNELLYTNDGGITWEPRFVNLGDGIYGITFINLDMGWIVGGNSTILHTKNGGIMDLEERPQMNQGSTMDVKIYPNPFSTSTTIEYELKHPENVRITIYNQFGKEVDRIEQKQSQGKQHVIWKAESQPAGIYYFRLQAGEQEASGKVVLVR